MRILVFDTETSGLDPQWNVILQLSYQIVDSDSWTIQKKVNHYFSWPENKARVTMEAIDVNGLTEEVLSSKQLSNRKVALEEFVTDKDSCDLLVAHNLEFDKKFIIASCREEDVKYASSGWFQSYDTMKRTTSYCQIPKDWGNGYKWPKLTELADCLHLDYSDIALHDSSADVELTKRCFKRLIALGVYNLPQESDMTITLHVEGPEDIHFIVKRNGEPVSQSTIDSIPKKSWNAACQELIQKWSEENEEERNNLIQIYRKSPKLKTTEDFRTEIDSIKPSKYSRKPFDKPYPSKIAIQEELELEAEREVSSWKFWTLKKMRQEYVETRMEPYFQEQVNTYNKAMARHEEAEDKAEKEFLLQSQKRCEERKRKLVALIDGEDGELLKEQMLRVPEKIGFSFPYHIKSNLDGTIININLSLPQPKDLPQLEGVRLASGNYKIKEIPDKNKKKDYSDWVWGIALYVASYYFNISPKINTISIKGYVTVDSNDIPLYDVSFDRDTYGSIDLENTDIETVLSHFSVSSKLQKDVLAKLFVVKETEPKKETKGIPAYMRDSLFDDAARFVISEKAVSISMVQRKFQLGMNRGLSIMEQLEKAGVVGPMGADKMWPVLVKDNQELESFLADT